MNSVDWGALLPMWLLGAPLLLAIASVLFDGTLHRSHTLDDRVDDRRAPLGGVR